MNEKTTEKTTEKNFFLIDNNGLNEINFEKYKELTEGKAGGIYKNFYTTISKKGDKEIILIDKIGFELYPRIRFFLDKFRKDVFTKSEKIFFWGLGICSLIMAFSAFYTYNTYSSYKNLNDNLTSVLQTVNNNNVFKIEEILTSTYANGLIIDKFNMRLEFDKYKSSQMQRYNNLQIATPLTNEQKTGGIL